MLLLFVFIILMIVLGVAGFFFKDKIKSLFGNKKDKSTTPAQTDELDGLANSLSNKMSNI